MNFMQVFSRIILVFNSTILGGFIFGYIQRLTLQGQDIDAGLQVLETAMYGLAIGLFIGIALVYYLQDAHQKKAVAGTSILVLGILAAVTIRALTT